MERRFDKMIAESAMHNAECRVHNARQVRQNCALRFRICHSSPLYRYWRHHCPPLTNYIEKSDFLSVFVSFRPRRECSDTPLPAGAPCGECMRLFRDKAIDILFVLFDHGKTLSNHFVCNGNQCQSFGFPFLSKSRVKLLTSRIMLTHRPRGNI